MVVEKLRILDEDLWSLFLVLMCEVESAPFDFWFGCFTVEVLERISKGFWGSRSHHRRKSHHCINDHNLSCYRTGVTLSKTRGPPIMLSLKKKSSLSFIKDNSHFTKIVSSSA